MNADKNGNKKDIYRIGLVVFLLLAVLTIGEFFIGAIAVGWSGPLWVIAILKAWLVVRDYMHLPRLYTEDKEGLS